MKPAGLIILALWLVLSGGAGCASASASRDADMTMVKETNESIVVMMIEETTVLGNFLLKSYQDLGVNPHQELPIDGKDLAAIVARFNTLLGQSAFHENTARLVSDDERRLLDLPGPPACKCNELVVENPIEGKIYYIYVHGGKPDFMGWWPSHRPDSTE
ncbi:MAG: hypothetical protein CO030_01840 [Candidatus Magasanikbacteria bacterium CG_4_9_14_0_2_um_filter_42_11]|uniref:Uncharacterized protein n=1 Tax=Candidatus Magasanikbacteria bacterium CG_4_9_14_0_2_um_filter_42_11 TaxID=1974643 RepID=A0A2M8FA67_9BACT|nr:MAG: hypothetical protein COU34_04855 [Candidatus Magasanikbacteria bacterium CG10_big_fil_rev_8_21_14_0_10_43_9]PIY92302.1 MAG: hypothetical protein COY70_03955 [Candidatus Magasanikbacteria bacterium CG_4_10_14_0_8_um_filter_42_12]PJC52630.1 MAG: hypothetical protein CO030_01840 [Candidatus Magasanikbacteria bacterium CG_4_9_14_0_2_um_filter_42_11]